MYSRILKNFVGHGARSICRRYASTERSSISELAKKSLTYTEKDGYVLKSPYEPHTAPNLTLEQYIWKNMPQWQNHIAITCGTTGREYTYAQLRDHCAALAIRLRRELNLEKNDIVGICLPNVPGKNLPISNLLTVELATSFIHADISRVCGCITGIN